MKNKNIHKNFPLIGVIQIVFLVFLICIQVKLCYTYWQGTATKVKYIYSIIEIFKILIICHIILKLKSPAYKLLWIILIAILPMPAMILYVVIGDTEMPDSFKRKLNSESSKVKENLEAGAEIYDDLLKQDKLMYNQANFLFKTTGLPLYRNNRTEYFDTGEKFFECIIEDINNAKKYIFLEWFTITEGVMWDRLYNSLKHKINEGVKVYLVVDGMFPKEKRPKDFKEHLEKAGIKYNIFNPINININSYINHRDHRKIVVIDGDIAYNGGLNVGDEYINLYNKFGYWKDTGIKISGDAASSYVAMFIRTWNACSNGEILEYNEYINKRNDSIELSEGFLLPYCDGPDNNSRPAKNLYIQMITTARNYIYITTPYLAIDNEFITSLINSAKSGVDVRIITPYIPDKKLVHKVTRSFYHVLLEAGVKIYEYKPGFIHSKSIVIDDELAVVGTINLDYRSLYFHYECANWMYKSKTEIDVRDDFIKTQEVSSEIKLDAWRKRGKLKAFFDKILITFAPLI